MQRTKCGALAHKFITGSEVSYNILSTMTLFLTFDIHNTYIVYQTATMNQILLHRNFSLNFAMSSARVVHCYIFHDILCSEN